MNKIKEFLQSAVEGLVAIKDDLVWKYSKVTKNQKICALVVAVLLLILFLH